MQQHLHYSNFKATQVEKVNAEAVVGQMLFLNQTLEPLLSYLKDQDIIKRLYLKLQKNLCKPMLIRRLWAIFSAHPA